MDEFYGIVKFIDMVVSAKKVDEWGSFWPRRVFEIRGNKDAAGDVTSFKSFYPEINKWFVSKDIKTLMEQIQDYQIGDDVIIKTGICVYEELKLEIKL